MPRPRRRKSVRRKPPARRGSGLSPAALKRLLRPIVLELMAEEWEKFEDRLDAADAREALAEPGGISHEELVGRLRR